jgi:hypothetical protein
MDNDLLPIRSRRICLTRLVQTYMKLPYFSFAIAVKSFYKVEKEVAGVLTLLLYIRDNAFIISY